MKKHIWITGRVQGVGFRHFTRKNAESLGVFGWVKNLTNGQVEAVFEGDEDQVDELIERCKKGPPAAYVKEIKVEEAKEKGAFSDFQIRF